MRTECFIDNADTLHIMTTTHICY